MRSGLVALGLVISALLAELVSHHGQLVRVAGAQHAEFEWVALFPAISDRRVMVQGIHWKWAGHAGTFNEDIDARRLDVWSVPHRPFVARPHRPFVTTPVAVPPPVKASSCAGETRAPEPLAGGEAARALADAFARLYETGEFQPGSCLAQARVRDDGSVDSVRVVPSPHLDERVEAALVRSLRARRYKPAMFCGRRVAFTLTLSVSHCPSLARG